MSSINTLYCEKAETRGETAWLGYDTDGASSPVWPKHCYFIELPGGMRHWFKTEQEAKKSQYWPLSA